MTTTAALLPKTNRRRTLLALVKLAEDEAQWLRFTDRDGKDVSMAPERVRDLIDTRYYQDQEWRLISPLDVISEAATLLDIAHSNFQAAQRTVRAWYDHRRAVAVAKDREEHGDAGE